MDGQLRREARVFCRYLVGKTIEPVIAKRYASVITNRPLSTSPRDAALVRYAADHPRRVAYLDAYCALFRPQAELRRRLFIMFALLESAPDYYDAFIPRKRSIWYVVTIGLTGCRAVLRVAGGLLVYAHATRSRA